MLMLGIHTKCLTLWPPTMGCPRQAAVFLRGTRCPCLRLMCVLQACAELPQVIDCYTWARCSLPSCPSLVESLSPSVQQPVRSVWRGLCCSRPDDLIGVSFLFSFLSFFLSCRSLLFC